MKNLFLNDRAVNIIRPIAQRHLGELHPQPNPIGGDMSEIIQVDATDRNGAQGIETRGLGLDGNVVILGMIGERNETGEPMRLVLQSPQLPQMIHSVSQRFHMAIKHGAGAASPQLMPRAVDIEIFLGGFFTLRDGGADFLAENLCATASQRIQPGFAQLRKCLANILFGEPGEVQNFDRREAFQLELRVEGFAALAACPCNRRTATKDAVRQQCGAR